MQRGSASWAGTVQCAVPVEAACDYLVTFYTPGDLSSLVLYRSLQPVYCYANYLSSVNCFYNKKLISRFRCMWTLAALVRLHRGLTGRTGFVKLVTPQLFKMSTIFSDCPAYTQTRDEFPPHFQISYPSVNLFIDFNMLGRYLRQCFLIRGQPLGLAWCVRRDQC